MKHDYKLKINYLKNCLLILAVVFILVTFGKAKESDPSMCSYVDNAERIFVGNFKRHIEVSNKDGKSYQLAEFNIMQGFRGFKQETKTVLVISGVYEKRLQLDEIYLVFLRFDEDAKNYSIAAPFPVIFLDNSISKYKTMSDFKIAFGDFSVGNLDDLKNTKISISANGKEYSPKFVPGGVFAVVFSQWIKVNFTIEMPVELDLSVIGNQTGVKSFFENGRTIVKYDIQNANCVCDYKQFKFYYPEEKTNEKKVSRKFWMNYNSVTAQMLKIEDNNKGNR